LTDQPVVVFLCTHNAGRSLAARVLLDHYAQGRIDVRSAGSEPADELNAAIVAVLFERGLDPSEEFPKPLDDETARAADVIVTMGCGDTCPYYPGKRYLDWDLPDPHGQPVETIRPIVAEIDRRVQALLAELIGGARPIVGVVKADLVVDIRALKADDWPEVATIYAAGIATGNATFETEAPTWEDWNAAHRTDLRFVAVQDTAIVGWIAAGAVSDRCCYGGVVEHSVYVHPDHQGQGIGRLLLNFLIDRSEAVGVWTIQTGIFPENAASIALHQACGFRKVGRRERLGQLNGTWRDVLLLERRSRANEARSRQ
jgi:L-amino acid N-acyltransferase YncA/protein-tyrosine-phosphatase